MLQRYAFLPLLPLMDILLTLKMRRFRPSSADDATNRFSADAAMPLSRSTR